MTEPLISQIRPDQIHSAARAMATAFANAPRYTFLLPDDEQRRAKLPWVWGTAIRACVYSGGVVHVAHDGSGVWASQSGIRAPLRCCGPAFGLRSGWAWRRRRALGPALAAIKPPYPYLPERHWSRPFKSTQWSGKRPHQSHAGADRQRRHPVRIPRHLEPNP